jgi:alcohol dehydrogenase class IV
MMPVDYEYDFSIVSRPCRVHSGEGALSNIAAEVRRQRCKRAFVICGRTVSRRTELVERIRANLGDLFVGIFDGMGKETPLPDVLAARDAARAASADLLIGVGAGSVIQGTRAVAIALAEAAPLEDCATQYPDDGPPVSPRLLAPKLPIINVLTVGTSAQNRSGSPLKVEGLNRRLELFDPKTRPVAIFWDAAALMTAPASMVRNSGAAIYWRAAMNMGYSRVSVLSVFYRRQAFELMTRALPRLEGEPDAATRIDLCIATFLQNRDTDDGAARTDHWPVRVIYAFAAGLFHNHEEVSQGAANSVFTPTVFRRLGARDPAAMCRIAEALGVWRQGDPVLEAPMRAADAFEGIFTGLGLPVRLSQLDIPRTSADAILANALRNYNSDPNREFEKEEGVLREVLDACW